MTKKNQGQIRKSLRRNFSWKFEELNETTSSFVVRSFEDDIGWIACLMVDLWLLWSRIGLKIVKCWNRSGLDLGFRKVNHLHLHLGKFIIFRQDNHLHLGKLFIFREVNHLHLGNLILFRKVNHLHAGDEIGKQESTQWVKTEFQCFNEDLSIYVEPRTISNEAFNC